MRLHEGARRSRSPVRNDENLEFLPPLL